MGNDNFVFVTNFCCLRFPPFLTKPCWTVTMIKDVQANIRLSLIVLHALTHVDITWA